MSKSHVAEQSAGHAAKAAPELTALRAASQAGPHSQQSAAAEAAARVVKAGAYNQDTFIAGKRGSVRREKVES